MDADPIAMSEASQAEIHRVQRIIQLLLRGGLAISVVAMTVGLVMKVASGSRHTHAAKLFALSSSGSTADVIMAVGVLVLALTPAVRVVALVVLWTRERDWRFVAVACSVVVSLSLAVLIGHG